MPSGVTRPKRSAEVGKQGEYPVVRPRQVQHREVHRCTVCLLGDLAVEKVGDLRPAHRDTRKPPPQSCDPHIAVRQVAAHRAKVKLAGGAQRRREDVAGAEQLKRRAGRQCRLFEHRPLDQHEIERVTRLNGERIGQVLVARCHQRSHESALDSAALLGSKVRGNVGPHTQQTHPAHWRIGAATAVLGPGCFLPRRRPVQSGADSSPRNARRG